MVRNLIEKGLDERAPLFPGCASHQDLASGSASGGIGRHIGPGEVKLCIWKTCPPRFRLGIVRKFRERKWSGAHEHEAIFVCFFPPSSHCYVSPYRLSPPGGARSMLVVSQWFVPS